MLAAEPDCSAAIAGLAAARLDPLDEDGMAGLAEAGFAPYDFLVLHVSVPAYHGDETGDLYVVGNDPLHLRWWGATTMDGLRYATGFEVSVQFFRDGVRVGAIEVPEIGRARSPGRPGSATIRSRPAIR